ncbi:BCIP domain containing protein, partial [Asbolus verrucosus]
QETPCVQQLYELVDEECKKHADQTTQVAFKEILSTSNKIGFIINERFVNIPSKISSIMLNSLQDEIERMKKKNINYKFEYFLMICKIWKPKGSKHGETTFSNDEEEIFHKKADCSFDYSVADKSDTGLTGNWQSEDKELVPYRRVILFKSDKFNSILNEIKNFVMT